MPNLRRSASSFFDGLSGRVVNVGGVSCASDSGNPAKPKCKRLSSAIANVPDAVDPDLDAWEVMSASFSLQSAWSSMATASVASTHVCGPYNP